MKNINDGRCPVCDHKLMIKKLVCPSCLAEFPCQSHLSVYDYLSEEQSEFLRVFLTSRGNLKELQEKLQLSYPAAKKKLESLLITLGFNPEERLEETDATEEPIDLTKVTYDENSTRASDIIKNKLVQLGGSASVRSINGKIYEIRALPDGKTFFCDQLPITPAYKYTIFDTIVDLLIKNGGTAEKGNGRNYKLGEPHCTANTVVGAVAIAHSGKKEGDSIFDPVFVLASVLDWACIAHNRRGYIELTKEYKAMLM